VERVDARPWDTMVECWRPGKVEEAELLLEWLSAGISLECALSSLLAGVTGLRSEWKVASIDCIKRNRTTEQSNCHMPVLFLF